MSKIVVHGEKPPILWIVISVVSTLCFTISLTGFHSIFIDMVLLIISIVILIKFAINIAVKKRISVDLLMGVAGLATWYIDAILEGFLIFLLYSVSELIEYYAERYASRKIESLRELLPSRVSVQKNSIVVEKNIDDINVGDIILVKPGDTVPVDGVIIEGESHFDTSYVTGESEPVFLRKGEYVESGYINRGNLVKIKVLRKPGESLLQLLVAEAERSLARKAVVQRFIERFSQPYTLMILGLFIISAYYLGFYRALAILLAGCPSAYIISSSTSTALTIAILARRTIVARGGLALEKASKTKIVVFDKTGTITLGKLKVDKIVPMNTVDEKEILMYAAIAAKASNHPVAQAIAREANGAPQFAREYPGKGVEATIDNHIIHIGSREFLVEQGIINNDGASDYCVGGREVYISINRRFSGVICLSEELSKDTRDVISYLKKIGLKIVIASGDRLERVRSIAKHLDVDAYYAELNPFDKKDLVVRLRREYGDVAMVGDGVNDLEALAEADVGIAVGNLNVVSSIADIVMPKGIKGLPLLFTYARKYMRSIYSAIITAFMIKTGVIILGLMGLLPLWAIVGIGDDGSTLISLMIISFSLGKTVTR